VGCRDPGGGFEADRATTAASLAAGFVNGPICGDDAGDVLVGLPAAGRADRQPVLVAAADGAHGDDGQHLVVAIGGQPLAATQRFVIAAVLEDRGCLGRGVVDADPPPVGGGFGVVAGYRVQGGIAVGERRVVAEQHIPKLPHPGHSIDGRRLAGGRTRPPATRYGDHQRNRQDGEQHESPHDCSDAARPAPVPARRGCHPCRR